MSDNNYISIDVVLDNLVEHVIYLDREMNIIWANRAAGRSVGKEVGEIAGEKCYMLWHGREEQCENCPVIKAMNTGEVWTGEVVTPDGRYWKITGSPVRGENGNITGAVETTLEVTEYRRVEEELRKKTEEQDILLDNIETQVWYLKDEENYRAANNAHAEFFGLKKEDLVNRNLYEITKSSEEARTCIKGNREVFDKKHSFRSEEWVQNSRGENRLLSITKTPKLDENGNVEYVVCCAEDITERRQYEVRIKEERDYMFQIFDSMNQYVIVNDSGYRVEFLNRAARERTANLEGKVCYKQLGKDTPCPGCAVTELLQKDSQDSLELSIEAFGMVLEGTATKLINLDGSISVLRVLEDVTDRKEYEQALYEEKEWFSTVVSSIGDAVIAVDTEGNINLINPVAEGLTGWKRGEAIGKKLKEVFHIINEETRLPAQNPVQKVLETGKIIGMANHTALISRDGTEYSIADSAAPIKDKDGEILGIIMVFRDVTQERRKERELAESEKRFRLLAENARDIIYRFNLYPDMRFEYISPAVNRIAGYTPDEVYKDPDIVYEIVHEEDRHFIKRMIYENPQNIFTMRWVCKDGTVKWMEQQNNPIYNAEGKLIAIEGIARDITERKQIERKLEYLSHYDQLTGVYNRHSFEKELSRLEEEKICPVGIIACDVDGLKLVNDTLGHDAGDKLLIDASHVLKAAFRRDDIIARTGGDEFAVLLPGNGEQEVEMVYQRLKYKIDEFNQNEPEIPLNISAGYSVRKDPEEAITDIFKEADNNMYREKLHQGSSARSAIVNTLTKALEERDFITEGHADRLQEKIALLARTVGIPERRMHDLQLLAQFHDIGKVGIPDRILFKPGPLTAEEKEEMKRHCEIGYRIAQSSSELLPIADFILKHHEWWNGKGYPLGLAGKDIPLECRVLSIVDAYDAMTSNRPYRNSLSHETAIQELRRCAGTQFDPEIVKEFIEVMDPFKTH